MGFFLEKGKPVSGTEKHRRENVPLKKIESVTGWIASIITIIMALPSFVVFIFRNKYAVFCVVIICCFIFIGCLVCKCGIWNIEKSNDKIISERKFIEGNIVREYIDKKLLFQKLQKRLNLVMIVCVAIVVFDIYNYNKFMESVGKDTANPPNIATQGTDKDINTLEHKEENGISYDEVSNISFCLNEAIIPRLEEQDAVKVFYTLYQNGTDVVRNHVDELCSGKELSGIKEWEEEDEKNIASASTDESIFKANVEGAKAYKEKRKMEEWQNAVPNVSDYKKNVLDVRIALIENGKADGEICYLAANDSQYIGDEYKNQNREYEAVIYYWAQSIIYIEKALSFGNLSKENREKYYGYLKARYKDIADYIEQIWDQIEEGDKEVYGKWRDAARRIYEEMP